MRKKNLRALSLIVLVLLQILNGCKEEMEPITGTNVQGTVKNAKDESIYPAYIILEDSLLATTDELGKFQVSSLESGTYTLLFSSINFADKSITVDVKEGQITNTDIVLTADETVGWLIGEFQDESLFEENVTLDPEKANWTAKEICDGYSGATIQTRKLSGVPESTIYIGDQLIATADDYGLFGFELQCGTYPFTGSCMGYRDTTVIIKVEPDSDVYYHFLLSKEEN